MDNYNTNDWMWNMKKIINSGIYDIEFQGDNDAEFIGNHPTLILKSIKNKEMFYVFPLTTYTEERWKQYKKNYCCRIITTNSIVRIDKVKVLHRLEIRNRWIKNDLFIIPKPEEIATVYKKYLEYIEFSTNASIKDYQKYYKCYNTFLTSLYDLIENHIFSNDFIIDFAVSSITFNSNLVYHLSFDDVKHIIYSVIGKDNVSISCDKGNNTITIKIKKDEIILTMKREYDKLILTKGNVNKTSVNIS